MQHIYSCGQCTKDRDRAHMEPARACAARSYVVYATDLTACVTPARPVQIRILEGLNSRVLNQLDPEDMRPAPRLYKGEQSLVEEGASTRHARRRGSAPRENNHAESRPYTRAREERELITALPRAIHTLNHHVLTALRRRARLRCRVREAMLIIAPDIFIEGKL
jgi:hypothetical protein